jgi:hexosaminidase
MKNFQFLLIGFVFLLSCNQQTNNKSMKSIAVVPKPASVILGDTDFTLHKKTPVYIDSGFQQGETMLNLFNEFLSTEYNFKLSKDSNTRTGGLSLKLVDSLPPEAYVLDVNTKEISIIGADYNGIFYGMKTLQQLIFQNNKSGSKTLWIPGLQVSDAPVFSWRGMHLDVVRHFFSKEQVMHLLEVMADYKLNTFHWHLTDDQGWRIAINKYPQLAEKAAWRSETIIGHMAEHPKKFDGKPHGGFYTQDEIKEVIEFARKRGITVVSEVEMPGHALAALGAFPELSCTGTTKATFTEWGISHDVFCAGNEATFEFLNQVLDEVMELFPSNYIHIGGDECPKTRWKACPKCQQRMQTEGLTNEQELQSYFIKRIEAFVNSKGKQVIGWDEILEGGLPERATVMSWRNPSHAIAAATQGHDVIMSPNATAYLDHYQSEKYEPLSIGGLTDLKEVYDWQIIPDGLPDEAKIHILGAQANMWTEYVATNEHLEYMLYPRLIALAENAWIEAEQKDFADFQKRMNKQYTWLDKQGINYRIPYPMGFEEQNYGIATVDTLELFTGIETAAIHYTLDGSVPDENSMEYTEPLILLLNEPIVLNAVTLMPSGRKSAVSTGYFKQLEFIESLTVGVLESGLRFSWEPGEFKSAKNLLLRNPKVTLVNGVELPKVLPSTFFGAVYQGYINIPHDGLYTFRLQSDDGAALYIAEQLVSENAGFKFGEYSKGTLALKAGYHLFKLNYFQAKYGANLSLYYQIGKAPFQKIPNSWFWYK